MAINAIEKESSKGLLRGRFKRTSSNENYLSLDAFLKSDFLGNRPELSLHATKASSRRGQKSDATCSPGPATTRKSLKRSASGPISHGSQESPGVLGNFPAGSTAAEIFNLNSPWKDGLPPRNNLAFRGHSPNVKNRTFAASCCTP
jgi:hypothetical protein